MNYYTAVLTVAFISLARLVSGQQINETSFLVGINKNSYPEDKQFYQEELPTYLIVKGSKSWYSESHRISLRKEAGLNFLYSPIGYNTGGLGASSKYSGGIASLFASVSLQPRIRISNALALAAGPETELLLLGYNNLDDEYYSLLYDPPTFGNKKIKGLNRNYFNEPSYGLKASLMESNPDSKVSVGLSLSFLWTKSEPANFYAKSYTRFSIVIGFKKQKDKAPGGPNP
jgi:hypothetical protein